MSYEKQTWNQYDELKTEEENIKNGAVVTDNRMNHMESGIGDNDNNLASHLADTNNPHKVTAAQVGLGNVDNVKQAAKTDFDSHVNNKNNPHTVTAVQIGLDKVINVKQASKVEFDSHTSNNSNPHKVTAAQVGLDKVDNVKQAAKTDFDSHINNKANPHSVTASQVGSYSKAETDTKFSSVQSKIDNLDSNVYTAYANSIDGSQDFTPGYPNLNLLDGTKDFSGTWNNSTLWTDDGTYNGLKVRKRTAAQRGTYKTWTVPNDGIYTFSCYVKSSGPNAKVHGAFQVNGIREVDRTFGDDFDWKRDSLTRTLKAGDSIVYSYEMAGSAVDSTIWVAGYKIEPGLTATPYMPSSSEVTTADYPQYKYVGRMAGLNVSDKNDPKNYMWQTNTDVVRDDSGKVTVKTLQVETIKSNSDTVLLNLSLTGVASATFSYIRINGIVYITAAGNWGNFPDNKQRIVGNIPAGFRPPADWGTGMNPQGGSRLLSAVIKANGDLGVTSDAAQNNVYGQFSMSYPVI
ncbi:hypothetical protein [Lactococcus lactis]|uniref:hypothetical protein n=1 Tax=Lactococcus lactis TaxID=1358 RepID=UPI000C00507B|nr:hypothetical protein [Lactococcus lactis]PFG86015.1 hypothetical protein BW153_07965 [Lactococcus lactis]